MYYYPQRNQNNSGGIYNIPPSPIGNAAPIGYGGYTNGYYSSNNYNRYNPYEIQRKQEAQMAQQREFQRTQSSIFKKLHKASATYLGNEIDEEELKMYDPVYDTHESYDLTYDEKMEYYRLSNIENGKAFRQQQIIEMEGNLKPFVNIQNNRYLEWCQRNREEIPHDVGLVEYLEKYAPVKFVEAMENDQREKQKDLTNVYNKADYSKLLGIHKSSPSLFGNALNPNASIDDQTIQLPTYISDKVRQERRAKFLDSIMKGGGY